MPRSPPRPPACRLVAPHRGPGAPPESAASSRNGVQAVTEGTGTCVCAGRGPRRSSRPEPQEELRTSVLPVGRVNHSHGGGVGELPAQLRAWGAPGGAPFSLGLVVSGPSPGSWRHRGGNDKVLPMHARKAGELVGCHSNAACGLCTCPDFCCGSSISLRESRPPSPHVFRLPDGLLEEPRRPPPEPLAAEAALPPPQLRSSTEGPGRAAGRRAGWRPVPGSAGTKAGESPAFPGSLLPHLHPLALPFSPSRAVAFRPQRERKKHTYLPSCACI